MQEPVQPKRAHGMLHRTSLDFCTLLRTRLKAKPDMSSTAPAPASACLFAISASTSLISAFELAWNSERPAVKFAHPDVSCSCRS